MSILDNICLAELRLTKAAYALIPENFRSFQEIKKHTCEELANKKPQLMFYGIYSHGKSTLINALRGIDEAPMDIQPTTYQIDQYDCPELNCVLVDTPGFQAKIEHTQEAEKQCRKSHLVIFVVQSGEFEVAQVWDKLKEVVNRGQKACLVINDFDNCLDDAQKIVLLKDNFRSRMQDVFKNPKIVEKVPLVIVDADTALNARMENNSALLKYSNLHELEYHIREMVAECNLKENAEEFLTAAFSQIISDCRAATAKGADTTLKEAEENLEEIRRMRGKFKKRLYDELNYHIDRMELYSMFFRNMNAGNTEALMEELEQSVEKLAEEMERVCQRELEYVSELVSNKVEPFQILLSRIMKSSEEQEEKKSFLAQQMENIDLAELGKIITPDMVKEGTLFLLHQAKKWLPELMRGIGDVTMRKWAEQAAKLFGPIMVTLSSMWELWSCHERQEEEKRREAKRRQSIKEAAYTTENNIRAEVQKQIDGTTEQIFTPLLLNLETVLKSARKESEEKLQYTADIDEAEKIFKQSAM